MTVKITFKIGDHRGASANYNGGLKAFEETLGRDLMTKASNNSFVDVRRLKRVLDYRVTNSLRQAVSFAASTMVGATSARDGRNPPPTRISFDWQGEASDPPVVNARKATIQEFIESATVEWHALAFSTYRQKKKDLGSDSAARKHYVHTGKLRKELLQLATQVVQKTGTVQVDYKKNADVKKYSLFRGRGAKVTVGQIQLKYVPRLPVRTLPGLKRRDLKAVDPTMAFERSLGISTDSLEKLAGTYGRHRPLLQPVFTYWILRRLPLVTASAINNAIVKEFK